MGVNSSSKFRACYDTSTLFLYAKNYGSEGHGRQFSKLNLYKKGIVIKKNFEKMLGERTPILIKLDAV